MNAVTSQIFIGRNRNVLHKQPIQMAAANPYIRGDVIHIDASRIVIVDKLKRFFHIFITAFFLLDIKGTAVHHRRHKGKQSRLHSGLVAGPVAVKPVNVQKLFPVEAVLIIVENWLLRGKPRFADQALGVSAVKPHPIVFPGVALIRPIGD